VSTEWDGHAKWWQDDFTDGADPEYTDQIVPLTRELLGDRRHVVELGAGEGQLARALIDEGVEVTALDISLRQVALGAQRGAGVSFVQASAEAIPIRPSCADGVLACLMLEHVRDFEAAISQGAALLGDGGRFVVMLNHPLLQTPGSGWIDDHVLDPPEQYWRVGPYLTASELIDEVSPGVHIRFFHRPLSHYVNAMADSGLVIERILEPSPPQSFLDRASEYRDAALIPRLMVLVARPA
jgi:SAM-dependent methyltransferase